MENKYQQISVQKLATSTVDNRYLLQCNGLYYETSYSVAELVLMLQKYSEEKRMYIFLCETKEGEIYNGTNRECYRTIYTSHINKE